MNNYAICDENRCRQYWQKEVGGEQWKCPAWLIYAWCEEGYDVAWVKQDFKNKRITRQYEKDYLNWWFTDGWGRTRGAGFGASRHGGWYSSPAYAEGVLMSVAADPSRCENVKLHRSELLTALKERLNQPGSHSTQKSLSL